MRLAPVVVVLTSSLCACGRGAAPASAPAAEPGAGGRVFDRAAATAALSVSADAARSECQKPGQPGVQGEVKVTFAPSGAVTSSTTDAAWGGTPIGGCVLAAFRSATVPPFDGVAVTVTKSIDVP
jgi:hypothetical protein